MPVTFPDERRSVALCIHKHTQRHVQGVGFGQGHAALSHASHQRGPPVGAPQVAGNAQGLGLQVTPSSVRNFVCCCMTGASAPLSVQFT